MNPTTPLPSRPRLADHGALRRRMIRGEEHLFIRDLQSGDLIEISDRLLELLLCADGTRDLGGVVLAAVRKGVYRRASEVVALLLDLHQRGLLADGIEVGEPPTERDRVKRKLEVLDGYKLSCDANGTCCRTYDSAVFTQVDMERSRCLVPEVMSTEAERLRGFLPVQGSVPLHALVVTMVDGRCAYLADDGRCRIQMAGEAESKPIGCRIFPSTFVDDGIAIRVSIALECPCVLASLDREGGSSLVPEGAKVVSDLLPGSPIVRLPDSILVSEGLSATRSELRAWSQVLEPMWEELDDPLTTFWNLADAVGEEGLSTTAAVLALHEKAVLQPNVLGFGIMKLSSALQAKRASVGALLSPKDEASVLLDWMVNGAGALLDVSHVERMLQSSLPFRGDERFYFRATVFGHHLVSSDQTLEQSLRERAVLLLLARQLAHDVLPECEKLPAARYPLTAVGQIMHSQGLIGGLGVG